ncbi:MAG TPA: L-threonylcarbamoyladenylate synthase [Candidatus Dormibacteraeota bacterium]|nr:L-threonylcarbamoyladenylate synthase [Candidatus Dormibacteraeota bacterium]
MERLVLDPGGKWQDVARRAAVVLRAGGVALLPAEGVYGLHALSENPVAVERLLALKPREEKKGFIGLIADPEELPRWTEPNARALSLAKSHWPGALTLVLRAGPSVPAALRNPDGTIALRCPGSAFLLATVAGAGGIVLSTSANRPGEQAMVVPVGSLVERADLVVDGGTLSGTPSTVVSVVGDRVHVLRPGAIPIVNS